MNEAGISSKMRLYQSTAQNLWKNGVSNILSGVEHKKPKKSVTFRFI